MSTGDDIGRDLDGAHWRFALALYAQPGVADACLFLQDQFGVDVNVLLFAMFAAAECGMTITPEDVREMDAAAKTWRSEAVVPLRTIRRRLKQAPEPAAGTQAEVLRSQVKRAELLAEQIEQALLARWLKGRSGCGSAKDVDLDAVLRTVVAYFAQGPSSPKSTDAVRVGDAIQPLLVGIGSLRRGAAEAN